MSYLSSSSSLLEREIFLNLQNQDQSSYWTLDQIFVFFKLKVEFQLNNILYK